MSENYSTKKIFDNLLEKRINKLLITINKNYPAKFPKDKIDEECKYLLSLIKVNEVENKLLEIERKKISHGKNNLIAGENDSRCKARVWGPIYNRLTNEKITKIEKQFEVDNYKLLDIGKFNELYIIGSRCKKKGDKYCKLHSDHLIHGDYFDEPNQELSYHYLKDNNFIS